MNYKTNCNRFLFLKPIGEKYEIQDIIVIFIKSSLNLYEKLSR